MNYLTADIQNVGITLFTEPKFNVDKDESPFNTILSDSVIGVSGWPDIFSRNEENRTYDLTFKFKGMEDRLLPSLFFFWISHMASLLDKSDLSSYSCTIYRALTDPSSKTITRWSKAEGCFPISAPISDCFVTDSNEYLLNGHKDFEVCFKANGVESMNPDDLVFLNKFVKIS